MREIIIIACSIFKYELEHLKSLGKIKAPMVYIDSMLHMYPDKLNELLDKEIEKHQKQNIILIFGDCHARMIDYEKNKNILRTEGINCGEIFMGKEKYRKLRNEGAFFLLPEWTVRWKEVFIDYMGFKNVESSRLFMNDMHKKMVYIDTGFAETNQKTLVEIENFFDMSIEINKISLSHFENSIQKLIDKFSKPGKDQNER